MATVTGFTAARAQEIEDGTIVDGNIAGDNLILYRHDGVPIDAGNVRGLPGPTGPAGAQGVVWYTDFSSLLPANRQVALSQATGTTTLVGTPPTPSFTVPTVVNRRYRYALSGNVQFSVTTDIGWIRVYHGGVFHTSLFHGTGAVANAYHNINCIGRSWKATVAGLSAVTLQMGRPTGAGSMTIDPSQGEILFELIDVGSLA